MLTPNVHENATAAHPRLHPFEALATLIYTAAGTVELPRRREQLAAPDAARCEVCGDSHAYCGCEQS